MSVKTELLSILEANRGRDLSGEEMANQIGVSRTSVWKAVKALRAEGYRIDAVNNRGYRLEETSDILSAEGIRLKLDKKYQGIPIEVHKTVDSTNIELKRRSLDGGEHGFVLLSEEQTRGKGRLGRSFYSPPGTGIYMSILLRPEFSGSDTVLVTTAAAVAVCRAISDVLGLDTQIKWVNDVYFGEKKICGILTEAVSDCEIGKVDSVIVGIGINYRTEEFPEELKERAGSVGAGSRVPRNLVAAAVVNEFFKIYENLMEREFMDEYRSRSNVLGREVRFLEQGVWYTAKAVDLDADGGLVVEYDSVEEGRVRRTLHTGEITLRVRE